MTGSAKDFLTIKTGEFGILEELREAGKLICFKLRVFKLKLVSLYEQFSSHNLLFRFVGV